MLISLTVGKVDAGVAVLLTEDKRLIEFPSILLPPSITSGSIVDITVSRNPSLELHNASTFQTLQTSILSTYGLTSPQPPTLALRNSTQTSLVLVWAPLCLATSTLRTLSLFRNNAKAGLIPRLSRDGEPVLATKVSGLAIDTEYTFHLVLRTSAGTYTSNRLVVRTQKMTDLTGITVTPGPLPPPLKTSLMAAVQRIGAKLVEGVQIDTTHFVCTEGRGREWERALEMNIPVVRPEWLEGCEREGRIVGVRAYYLGADPKLRQVGQGVGMGMGLSRGSPAQTPMQTPSLAQDSQQSLPIREQESSTYLPVGGREQSQNQQASTPVTPWPVGLSQRPPAEEESESESEEEGKRERPTVPAKDGPRGDDEKGGSVSPPASESEEEDGASGAVSPEEEGPGGVEKPAALKEGEGEGVGESQSNFSEVDL